MKKKQKYQDLEKTAKFTKRVHPNLHRLENTRTEIKSFLIITEGVNTEPSYFEKFKLPTAEIEIVGVGRNTYSLVVYAITLMERRNQERLNRRKSKFDEVWCVFDADPKLDAPKQLTHFKNAIDLAHEHGIYVAYSNQAFEYWFILHFEDHQGGAMPRTDYASKLNGYLKPFGGKYFKSLFIL